MRTFGIRIPGSFAVNTHSRLEFLAHYLREKSVFRFLGRKTLAGITTVKILYSIVLNVPIFLLMISGMIFLPLGIYDLSTVQYN